jgi:predicted nucleic acid-binding protein
VRYLVDANVLSEPTKAVPDPRVVAWLRENERDLVIDPIVLGEIRFGIHLLAAGKKRRALERWFEHGVRGIACLPWDSATALRWTKLLADLRKSGAAMSVKDSLVASTALAHGLAVATRNTRDFARAGVDLVDPFG